MVKVPNHFLKNSKQDYAVLSHLMVQCDYSVLSKETVSIPEESDLQ